MDESKEVLFTEFFNKKLKERGLTLRQLADASGISIKYLESFSHGRFENLPPTPYLHGYFVRLGAILGFDPEEWWQKIRGDEAVLTAGRRDRLPKNRFALRRSRVLLISGIVLLLILGYFGLRFSEILGQPELTVANPPENLSVAQDHVTVSGQVRNADEVVIGSDQVPLGPDGSFSKDVTLLPGPNEIDIKALKLLGRTATVVRHVYYQASTFDVLQGSAATSTASSSAPGTRP